MLACGKNTECGVAMVYAATARVTIFLPVLSCGLKI